MAPHDIDALMGIGLSVILYQRLTDGALTPEMTAWETFMTLAQPDVWDSQPDPTHEGYADFKMGVEQFKKATREERLAMGRDILRAIKGSS